MNRAEIFAATNKAMHSYHAMLEEIAITRGLEIPKSASIERKRTAIRADINAALQNLAKMGERDVWDEVFDTLQLFDDACAEWQNVLNALQKAFRNASA
jgi:hypothetical protein